VLKVIIVQWVRNVLSSKYTVIHSALSRIRVREGLSRLVGWLQSLQELQSTTGSYSLLR